MGIEYHIEELSFDERNTSAYQLSILIGMDSLVYFISSTEEESLVLKTHDLDAGQGQSSSLTEHLQRFFDTEELMGLLYRRIRIALPQWQAVLIPERLFKHEELPAYLRSLTTVEDTEVVHSDAIGEGFHVGYKTALSLVNQLKKKFPTAHLFSTASAFISATLALGNDELNQYTVIAITGNQLQLAYCQKGEVIYYNTFPIMTASDVMYYTMLLYEQFELDPAHSPLFLAGQMFKESAIFKTLYRYIEHITFAPALTGFKWSRRFNEVPAHLFFNLYGLHKCKT